MSPAADEGFWAWLDLSRTYAAVARHIERRLRALGLTLAYAEVLVRLGQAPEGRLRVVELGERVFLTRSGISQLVSRMESAGLLRRESHPQDQRGRVITPTDDGWRMLTEAIPVFQTTVHEHFSDALDDHQIRRLRQALGAVIAALGEEPESTLEPRSGGTTAAEAVRARSEREKDSLEGDDPSDAMQRC